MSNTWNRTRQSAGVAKGCTRAIAGVAEFRTLASAATLLALAAGFAIVTPAWADVEADLLRRFQQQNQSASQKLKEKVEGSLAQAAAYATSAPERSYKMLREAQILLQEDAVLSKQDRTELLRRVDLQLASVTSRLEEKQVPSTSAKVAKTDPFHEAAWPKVAADPTANAQMKPPFFAPIVTPFPTSAAFQTTAVASPDRRWVRIGVAGTFNFVRPGAVVPVQIPVPNVLQGPGTGFTVLPPIGVTQKITPVTLPAFTTVGINTTAMAPSGGSVVLGGYSSSMQSSASFGTPVLGGIPYLSPFFRSRTYGGGQMNNLRIVGVVP